MSIHNGLSDMDDYIEEGTGSLCPLCDQPFFVGDEVKAVEAHEAMHFIHESCFQNCFEDDETSGGEG